LVSATQQAPGLEFDTACGGDADASAGADSGLSEFQWRGEHVEHAISQSACSKRGVHALGDQQQGVVTQLAKVIATASAATHTLCKS
jgi:hypothetical protein